MLADVCDRPNLTENADYDVDLGVYDIDLGPVVLVSYKGFSFLESVLTLSSDRLVSQYLRKHSQITRVKRPCARWYPCPRQQLDQWENELRLSPRYYRSQLYTECGHLEVQFYQWKNTSSSTN